MPAGRPVEYSEDILIKAKEYIDSCEDEFKSIITQDSDKYTMYKERLIVKLPTIEGLARYLKISRDTVYDWEKKYDEFSYILEDLRSKQSERLINNSLSGDYNSTIAKVLLTKHGYTDKQEIDQKTEHSGGISISWQEPELPNTEDKGST